MDELLALTGLKKVKVAAVALFKSALQFRRMSKEAQKANSLSLNYCFLGNPGTGKTTVARLFAKVLRDCSLRSKDAFIECTAQKLKDDGVDEFRKRASEAMDGVLFIDEAYDLDPVGDKFKGAPIVNEMVTLTENERERLTVILAGYEDDMNTKFFAHNSGLKSRFQEVLFEDFDEGELTEIWTHMRSKAHWTEADSRLTSVAVRRLLRGAGKKGFGNARDVRKRLEQARASAMSRPDFDPGDMVLEAVDVVGEDPRRNPKLQLVLADINAKTGWASIKKAVEDLVTVCGTNYQRELDGQAPLPVFLNRMFLGNPGTGKTTCAKLYGQVLKHLGFLTVGEVVFKTAGELGGSVVGEAQQKTLDILRGASGKVLVIDEAYNLDDNLYGKQVLDTLVEKVQGSESDDIAVLLLGYEAPMLAMIRNQNPGLARRFPPEQAFRFEDYSDKELLAILLASCRARGVKPTVEFQEKALRKLGMLRRSETNFGNAGAVNNLLQSALLKASSRGSGGDRGEVRLEECDVDIGPEGEAAGDPLAPLDKLYRMEGVKKKIQQLSNAFSVAQAEGSEVPELGHFVFTGAPGTGKTTVARVMAQILFDLRLTARNHVVETSGLNLTGEYVGQTKKKVEEQLDSAKGGVLFIDEAYELGRGPFGAEACTSIVAAMTDPAYSGLVIIIAGYQAEISAMLDTNIGLKSRFTHYFEFPNWAPSDCLQLFSKRAAAQNFALEPAAEETLKAGFGELVALDGWGNARDVDKLWKDSLRYRADRVAPAPETEKTLLDSDVRPAVDSLVKARRNSAGAAPKRQFPFGDLPVRQQSAEAKAPAPQATKQGEQAAEPALQVEEEQEAVGRPDGRDAGVSDEIWAELLEAKAAAEAREAELQRELEELRLAEEQRAAELERQWQEEMERIRLAAIAEQERLEAERLARAAHEAKLEQERLEKERRRREEERRREELRKAQAIQEKLRQISPCPAGFQWYKSGGGWRCGGGSHFVSDAELQRHFTH
uniref:AAA+ ATPase domain-containing protein n=1 Tax=Alexandrium monilatum TaxID=311494 RepID=A0A7S4Q8G3_9DINO